MGDSYGVIYCTYCPARADRGSYPQRVGWVCGGMHQSDGAHYMLGDTNGELGFYSGEGA